MKREKMVKRHIVQDVIRNNIHPNTKIIAYADRDDNRFRKLLKIVSDSPFEVRPLNDYNDNNFLRTCKIRWEDQLVAMYATTKDEFHIWLGGVI